MALQIISVLLFTVFFSKALTLKCYNCPVMAPSGICTQNATCPENSQCRSMITYDGYRKSCMNYASCANWSMHAGQYFMSSYCCASDLCNNAPVADPDNELMCYICSDTNCTNTQTLKCKGDEKQCFTAAVRSDVNLTVKGCASQNICTNTSLVNPALPPGLIVSSALCCGGNLCNSAQSTTQGLFLLVPVLSLLFSI